MHVLKSTFIVFAVFFTTNLQAQVLFCPENSGFEYGNFSNWLLYTGSCCPIVANYQSGPVNNRHEITSGANTDPYGGFPVVAPGGGSYSMKLGNDNVNSQAEKARYYVQVPAGVNDYSLMYRYAVVFEDPGHQVFEQPRFEVRAFDSATNTTLPCAHFVYVSSSTLPGFQLSSQGTDVWYKTWTTATLDLSGWAGHTIAVDFMTGDCDLGAHFGYGYVDMSCGLFQVAGNSCGSATTTFTAPPGFEFYTWMDSSFTTVLDTGQVATINTPPVTSTYHVILTPYSGFGCPDTLTTVLNISNIQLNGTADTTICYGSSVTLTSGATGNMAPFTYSWTPATGLSCTTCANPVATVTGNTTYYVTVTDTNGCSKSDTININVTPPFTINTTAQNLSCANANNGSATVNVSGTGNYTYSWTSNPVQTTQTANNLTAGTYTVTVANSNGCAQNATVTISQPPALTANISNTPLSCNGLNNGSATVSVSGGTGSYTYSWNSNPVQTTATASNLPPGNISVQITDANGCTANANTTITQPAVLNAYIAYTNSPMCTNIPGMATVGVTGGTGPYTYHWNTNPVQTTASVNNLPNGTYTATVTDANGCSDTAVVVIYQSPALLLSMSQTNISCNGLSDGSASVNVLSGTPPYTYQWSTTQTGTSINNLGVGTYMVTVVDSQGCTTNASVAITQPNALNAVVAMVSDVSCNGAGNGTAQIAVIGGTPGYSFAWNTIPVQTSALATNLQPGTYSALITDSHGCLDSVQVTITEPDSLDLTISSPVNATCGLPNGSATANATGGNAPYSYAWNTNPVQTTATASNLYGGTYIVTVTDDNGCTDNASVTLSQSPAVNVTATPVNISCNGLDNGSVNAIISGGTQPVTHSWNVTQTGLNIGNLSPGSYTIVVTDAIGCTDSASATITEPAALDANITNTADVTCFGAQNGSASVTVNGGTQPYNFLWNTGGTSANSNNMDTGSYTIIVIDANGCTDTASVHINQPDELLLNANALAHTCANEATGSAEATVTGGTTPYNITWSTAPQQTGTTAQGLAAGSYTVTATDANGCIKTASVNIEGYSLPTVDAGADQVYCYGKDSITLTASGAVTYLWSPAAYLSCGNCAITGANPPASTEFQVIGFDEHNCRDTDRVNVTVYTDDPASVGDEINVCKGESAQLFASGGESYSWSPAGYEVISASPTVTPDSTTTYTVVINKNICFSDTFSQRVIVHERPTISLGNDLKVLPGAFVQLKADTTHARSIGWDPASDLSCEACIDPGVTVYNTVTYTATVYNHGCKAMDDITITVSCDANNIFMANTFTPNNDGNNDIFFPQTPGFDKIKLFRVYNRWGQMLHEASNFNSNDPKFGWDGSYNGTPQSPDVYVYYLETSCPDGERVFKKGDISLLK
jgi:gliding motility-associated-like protein